VQTESESFRPADIDTFLDEFVLIERDSLAERLLAAGARLQELAPRVPEGRPPGPEGWSAHEVLAHIAALSKLYGMLTYRIGSGALTEFELMPMVNQRDSAGAALAQLPTAELAAMIQADHRRTLEYVRSAAPDDLRRKCALGQGREMSAGEVLRLALVAHVEQHVKQLEAALPTG
jgi:DinB superfamily